jgi:Fe-S-cluster containining protein
MTIPIILDPSNKVLPCFPCPHGGSCCDAGVDLTRDEYNALLSTYGAKSVKIVKGEPRTAVIRAIKVTDLMVKAYNTCFFKDEDCLCTIHDSPLYPAVCRAYPWEDGILGGPYKGDRRECPEFHKISY